MKKILVLLAVLLTASFSGDFFKLGKEAYDQKNYQKAAELFKKACDGGNFSSCGFLGISYASGDGVKQDNKKAVELLKKACDGGDATSCSALGIFYMEGIGVTKDSNKATELLKKACDGGDSLSCEKYEVIKNTINLH